MGRVRGRGAKTSKAVIAARRKRLTELVKQGTTLQQSETILTGEGFPADRVTLWRDLEDLRRQWVSINATEFEKLRQVQLRVLEKMEEWIIADKIPPDVAREWRAVRADIARLMGLNVGERINVSLDTPERTGLYMMFLQHVSELEESDLPKVWEFMKSLRKPPVLSPDCFPAEAKQLPGESDAS